MSVVEGARCQLKGEGAFNRNQVHFTFEDIAVYFSEEEWALLEDWQRELYKNVMHENYETLRSLGMEDCEFVKPEILTLISKWEEPYLRNNCDTKRSTGIDDLKGNEAGLRLKGVMQTEQNLHMFHHSTSFRNLPIVPLCSNMGFITKSEEIPTFVDRKPVKWNLRKLPLKEKVVSNLRLREKIVRQRTQAEGRPHKCTECEKSFYKKSHLKAHRKTHDEKPPLMCVKCQQVGCVCHSEAEVSKRDCKGKGRYKCKKLKKSISALPRFGFRKKPYKCDQCDKAFSFLSELDVHKRCHTGERPFKCTHCDRTYSRSAQLTEHLRVHTGERPFECHVCGSTFMYYSALRNHLVIHSEYKPFRCAECGSSYSRRTSLIIHQRTHTDEKPYTCTECGRSFSHSSNFIMHLRVHRGEKPYSKKKKIKAVEKELD